MAAWVLEALPEGCQVDHALVLSPALSPRYNMARAAKAVRGHLYVTHSWLDLLLMGLGTFVFGTMDGRHSVSAGLTGFRMPPHLAPDEREAYRKIRQIAWRPALIRDGHFGDHTGCTNTRFARRVLTPILLGRSDPGEPLEPLENA
jgi:hypothetical protein